MAEKMTITWLGHSCFQVESQGYTIILDPYEDGSVRGLGPLRATANEVLCSHGHGDHNAAGVINVEKGGVSPFTVTVLDTYHDDVKGAKRGPNKIHILDDGTFRVAHMGDLGCELTEEQKTALAGVDVMLIPVGGFFTIDAKQAKAVADAVKPRIVVPMHYRSEEFGYEVLAPLNDYTSLCDDVAVYDTNVLTLTKETPVQTAVLRYMK